MINDQYQLDHAYIKRRFNRAASTCENHDVLQREVQQELLQRLDFYLEKPEVVVDIGAGTGQGTALLKKRYPKATVIALDLSLAMLRASHKHRSRWRPFRCVAGNAAALPLPDRSADVLHANLCFQWSDKLFDLFKELNRVLKPGGFLVFSAFGPDTLKELRAAWAAADDQPHVGQFLDMHDMGDRMLHAGIHNPVLDISRYTLTYDTPHGLFQDLQGLGATNASAHRRRTLTGKKRFQAMLDAYDAKRTDGRIPATWEVVIGHGWGITSDERYRIPGVNMPPPVNE